MVQDGSPGAVTWSEELHSRFPILKAALHFSRPLATQVSLADVLWI